MNVDERQPLMPDLFCLLRRNPLSIRKKLCLPLSFFTDEEVFDELRLWVCEESRDNSCKFSH